VKRGFLTKLQFKDHENPMWQQILDAVGCSFALLRRFAGTLLKNVMIPLKNVMKYYHLGKKKRD